MRGGLVSNKRVTEHQLSSPGHLPRYLLSPVAAHGPAHRVRAATGTAEAVRREWEDGSSPSRRQLYNEYTTNCLFWWTSSQPPKHKKNSGLNGQFFDCLYCRVFLDCIPCGSLRWWFNLFVPGHSCNNFFFPSHMCILCILNRMKVSNYIWNTYHDNRRIEVGPQSFYTEKLSKWITGYSRTCNIMT